MRIRGRRSLLRLLAKSLEKNKPPVYLIDHLNDVLIGAHRALSELRPNISNQLHQSILLAAALHDIGKVDGTIQDFFRRGSNDGCRNKKHLPKSHALTGLPIIQGLLSERLPEPYPSLILLAVASHHTPLHSDLFLNMNPTLEVAKEDRDEATDVVNRMSSILAQRGVTLSAGLEWDNLPSPKSCYVQAKETGIITVCKSTEPETWRREYILIQGILGKADWLASGTQKVSEELTFQQTFRSARDEPIDPDPTQLTAEKTLGNAFVLRPTGMHKTETALYWARANTPSTAKVFYVLPTTVTINAMFKRLERNFPSQTGLYHSSADLFLDQQHRGENIDDVFSLYKYFFFPVNVTTPDQIILSLLNYKRYTLKSLPLYGATLILDEIHAYDGETFALIKGMLRQLGRTFGAKFCVMSATFPTVFRQELSFIRPLSLPSQNHTQDEYKNLRRTQYEYVRDEKPMINHLDEILTQCVSPRKVLIVLNTVKRAQDMYDEIFKRLVTATGKLREEDVMLLHARFTFADRNNKEARLDPEKPEGFPKVLVATQVVEVSLDISYDTMFTEACYPAELVQRLGRINRKGVETNRVNVFVYKPKDHFPYEKKPLLEYGLPLIEQWESQVRSEWDYLTMANQFYDQVWDQFKSPEDERRYEDVWATLAYLYSADLSDPEVQKLLRTRSGFLTLPAFPATYEEEVESLNRKIEKNCDVEERAAILREKRRLLIDVPITRNTSNLFITKDHDRYVQSPYDSNLGLQINSLVDNIL